MHRIQQHLVAQTAYGLGKVSRTTILHNQIEIGNRNLATGAKLEHFPLARRCAQRTIRSIKDNRKLAIDIFIGKHAWLEKNGELLQPNHFERIHAVHDEQPTGIVKWNQVHRIHRNAKSEAQRLIDHPIIGNARSLGLGNLCV